MPQDDTSSCHKKTPPLLILACRHLLLSDESTAAVYRGGVSHYSNQWWRFTRAHCAKAARRPAAFDTYTCFAANTTPTCFRSFVSLFRFYAFCFIGLRWACIWRTRSSCALRESFRQIERGTTCYESPQPSLWQISPTSQLRGPCQARDQSQVIIVLLKQSLPTHPTICIIYYIFCIIHL